jgi:hypothetical protein
MNEIETEIQEEIREAKEILRYKKAKKKHTRFLRSIPEIQDNMVLQYRDLTGYWYEYTDLMKANIYFRPKKLRVIYK